METQTANPQSLTPALASDPGLSPESRVWVYTSDRALTPEEQVFAQAQLDAFTRQWTAHNQALQAKAELFQNRFVILMVDETQAGASGCSIDKSVHFLESLGGHLGVDLFDRMLFGWEQDGRLEVAPRAVFAAKVQSGDIADETPVVNTLVKTKGELAERWLMPLGKSWHKRVL
jgi:hypothetical protein